MKKVLQLTVCTLVVAAGAYAQATAGLGAISGTVRDASIAHEAEILETVIRRAGGRVARSIAGWRE
jgi:hypothetical protein